jgi:phosphatidylethanolamine-binding protein
LLANLNKKASTFGSIAIECKTSMPVLTFGPASDQWTYDQETRTYDLSRSSAASTSADDGETTGFRKRIFTFATSHGPADTKVTISPAMTALVIVDMQNFFLHPRCRNHPTGLAAVGPTTEVIAKCRELGVEVRIHMAAPTTSRIPANTVNQVIWLNWGLTEDDLASLPASLVRAFSRSAIDKVLPRDEPRPGLGADLGSGMGRTLMLGSWNAEIFEPLARHVGPDDVHCAKNRMSGMWSPAQPLFQHLVASGRKTLLFAGVNTDQCVLGTLADAYSNAWDTVLVDDCCGTGTPGGREVCLLNGSVSLVFSGRSHAGGSLLMSNGRYHRGRLGLLLTARHS